METLSQAITASNLPTGCTMTPALRAFIGLATVAVIVQTALGANYIVGGAGGWNLGADFDTWASSQTFNPGDTLSKSSVMSKLQSKDLISFFELSQKMNE